MNRPQIGKSVGFSKILIKSVNNIIIYIFWYVNNKSYHMMIIHRGPILRYNLNHVIQTNATKF